MRTFCIILALLFNVSFSQPAYSNEGAYKCIDDELVEHFFMPELNDKEMLLEIGDGLSVYPVTHKSEKYILSEKTQTFMNSSILYIVWVFDRGDKTLTRRTASFGGFKSGFGQSIDVKMACMSAE